MTFACCAVAAFLTYFFTSFFGDASSLMALVFFDVTAIDGFDHPYLVTSYPAVTSFQIRILSVNIGARFLGTQVERHSWQSPSLSVL